MILLLVGCMPLDGFFFNPTQLDAYELGDDVVPAACQELTTVTGGPGPHLAGVWVWQGQGESCEPDLTAPTLVYFHGNTGSLDEYWPRMEAYWLFGFNAFMIDYRGYGMSEGTPTFDGVIEDGTTAVDYVGERTGLPPTEMSYLGLSLGGFVAVHNLAERPPKRLITEDMFASISKMLGDGTDLDIPAGWVVEEDWDNTEPLAAMDPTIPHLVMHGDSDTFVEPEHAQLNFDASAATVKDLWYVKDSDHAEDYQTDPTGYEEHVRCWLLEPDPMGCIGL